MKKYLYAGIIAVSLLFLSPGLKAQVHIGDQDAAVTGGTLLDLSNKTAKQGLLPLRVNIELIDKIPTSFTERKSDGPAMDLRGLVVYNTNDALSGGSGAGLYVWDGTKWNRMIGCKGAPLVAPLTAPTVCFGSNLVMSANVTSDNGSPILGYEWKLGTDIKGTTANLSCPVTTSDDGKTLTLSVTNLCGTTTTAGVQVTVYAALTQANPAAANVCRGLTTTLTLTPATGGSGVYTYLWQKSANGTDGWSDADGPNYAEDYTTPTTLTASMYFRRKAMDGVCDPIYSNGARVTVSPPFTQGNPASTTVCYGGTTTLSVTAATGGTGDKTYKWQQSLTGADGSWVDATEWSTNTSYTTTSLYVDMYYRRGAKCDCGQIWSNPAKVEVSKPNGGTVTGASGFIYATYSYPGLGVWTENVKEDGMALLARDGRPTGERGYYYYYYDAAGACSALGSEWALPTKTQCENLVTYLTGTGASADEIAFFRCGNARADWYSVDGDWWSSPLGGEGMWHIAGERMRHFRATASSMWGITSAFSYDVYISVRCVKSN